MGLRYQTYLKSVQEQASTVPSVVVKTIGETSVGPVVSIALPGDHTLVVVTGQHGEEPAGPRMVEKYLAEILAYASGHGVGLLLYPCVNPEGYEAQKRFNDTDGTEENTNNFIEYQIESGAWVGELHKYQRYTDLRKSELMCRESKLLYTDLEKLSAPYSMIDIHETDHLGPDEFYVYTTGDKGPLVKIVNSFYEVKPLRNTWIPLQWTDVRITTDQNGMVEFNDGTLTDYFYRRGALYTICLETSRIAPVERTAVVSLKWVESVIDLVGRKA